MLPSRCLRPAVVVGVLFCLAVSVAAPRAWGNDRLLSVILPGDLPRYQAVHQAFLRKLDVAKARVYTQAPNPDPMSLANSIRKAVAIQSEVIIAYGAQAALIAKREARSVPVLFADVYDPASLGLVRCHDDVACEVSGISASTPLETLLLALADLGPSERTIAALYSANDPGSELQCAILEKSASMYGFAFEEHDVSTRKELQTALRSLADRKVLLFVSDSSLVQQHVDRILNFAAGEELLVFSQVPGLCEKGALLSLEPDLSEQGEKLAEYVNKVLQGTAVSSLPVFLPHRVDLVLNLSVANRHQLRIPLKVLNRTTRIVK